MHHTDIHFMLGLASKKLNFFELVEHNVVQDGYPNSKKEISVFECSFKYQQCKGSGRGCHNTKFANIHT